MRNEMKIAAIVVAFVIFGMSLGLSIFYVYRLQETNAEYFKSYNKDEENVLREVINHQRDTDYKLADVIASKKYTFDDPYILENPYEVNPLSAVIAFNTSKKESVDVYINDRLAYRVKETKDHIIPIYGLYSNAVNIVTLKMGNNSKEIILKTDVYDNNHDGIDISSKLDGKNNYFLTGNIDQNNSTLRGFDNLGNLIYYLDLPYISGVKFYNTRLYVGYNSKYSKEYEMPNLKLEMDFLGKIYGISTDVSDLDTDNFVDNTSYLGHSINMYREKINNLSLDEVTDSLKYTDNTKISTNEIRDELDNASIYDKDFIVSMNGHYLTYDIDDDGMLVLVNKNTFNSYTYSLDNKHLIKVEPVGPSSLYLYKDGKYYTLLTTITN